MGESVRSRGNAKEQGGNRDRKDNFTDVYTQRKKLQDRKYKGSRTQKKIYQSTCIHREYLGPEDFFRNTEKSTNYNQKRLLIIKDIFMSNWKM